MATSSVSSNQRAQFWRVLLLVVATSLAFSSFFKREVQRVQHDDLNTPFPPIEVVGWLGGKQGPTPEELAGNVYVVDAWAHWCGPCRAAVPHLIRIYEKYKDKGVRFIGITNEGLDKQSLEMSQKYVEVLNIPYPNGFGAENLFDKLKVEGYPQLWVVDRQGRVVLREDGWGGSSPRDIEQAIEAALAEPAPAPEATTPAEPAPATDAKGAAETKEAPSK